MAVIASSALSLLVLMASSPKLVETSTFLHRDRRSTEILKGDVELFLFHELANPSKEILVVEEDFKDIYAALPKNDRGTLEPSVVRYALHRYFVEKNGWHVNGLDPVGQSWNASELTVAVDRAPAYIQTLLHKHVNGEGFGLRELAVFASTLTDLIHRDAVRVVEKILRSLALPTNGNVSRSSVDMVLKVYLMTVLMGDIIADTKVKQVNALEAKMPQVYPMWEDTLMWAQDLRNSFELRSQSSWNPFKEHADSFDDVVALAEEVGRGFSSFQKRECYGFKDKLVDREDPDTGRVRLSRFYHSDAGREWVFSESTEYLKLLGALDETNPNMPSVIIPNYLYSPSNCVANSEFYSVCCVDECEGLLRLVEKQIGAPSAQPTRLIEVVGSLPSDTTHAPRTLSASLVDRLQAIADVHDGDVQLHGRLFKQWMHHAYPRECPFPHEAGTIVPQNPAQYARKNGVASVVATKDDLNKYNETVVQFSSTGTSDAIPWSMVEELVAPRSRLTTSKGSPWLFRGFMFALVLASMGISLSRASKCVVQRSSDTSTHKVLV